MRISHPEEVKLPFEPTLYCFAIRIFRAEDGDLDTDELERFLDATAGPNSWLMLSVWAFAREPEIACSKIPTVPVICPEAIAARLKAAESEDRLSRIFGEHLVGAVELRGWRWVAATAYPSPDGRGLFPWEIAAYGGVGDYG